MFTRPDYSKPGELWLTEADTLRRLVGILGILLPLMLPFFVWIDTGHTAPQESISHYYFTRANPVFVIVVSLMAIFLLIYKGESKWEFWFSKLAGIGGLLLVLIPTDNIVDKIAIGTPDCVGNGDCYPDAVKYTVTVLRNSGVRTNFHFAVSGVFLGFLALLSLFVFTYDKGEMAQASCDAARQRMRQRNFIYRACAVLMVLAIVFIKLFEDAPWYEPNHLTFWMETVAVESFGISWLLRGDMLMGHKP
jgi:hypothetical protein